MINKIQKIALFLLIAVVYTSCETVDFGDINDSPNGPTAAVTSQLLTQAEKTVSTIGTHLAGTLYMQHITQGQYPNESKYGNLTYSYNGFYTGPIQNLNRIIDLNEGADTKAVAAQFGDNNNQIATAKILRAYILQFMTDRWGGLPWDEAFQGIDNTKPKFNTQEEIYNIMFAEIESALALMDATKSGPAGDVIFGGDMNRWELFANSLKMTMALRISDVNSSLAQSKFEEVITSGDYIMTNSQNIEFNYSSDDASDSPWHDRFKEREDYILSETLLESLRDNLDPRLFKYADPSRETTLPDAAFPGIVALFPGDADAKYVGAENGKVNGNVPDYSFPTSTIIYDETYPTPIYTAAQMKLSMAEAASKGWNVGGATTATLFTEGIEASMDYWDVSAADKAAYVATHTTSTMADIAYEKWVALYLNGPEAWAEWRRLDAPALTPSIYAADQRIPARHAYDSSVPDNNPANYAAIIASQGADDLHTKLWWDVN